jgi:hypothetical protein
MAAAMLFSVCPFGPASAQGLLDLLFGGPKATPSAQIPAPRLQRASPSGPGGAAAFEPRRSHSDLDGETASGTYRTVCVRMCDGYFTPMSFSTTRKNFAQDENKCRASCGGDARLFFYRNPGSTIDEATDLSGRVYARTPNAFRYRKALVDGCTCRPAPWSEASMARHRAYAEGPLTPVPGQPKPAAVRMADAASSPIVHNASAATILTNTAVAIAPEPPKAAAASAVEEPVKRVSKPRAAPRLREPVANAPVKTARVPLSKPVVVATAPQPKATLFGYGNGYGSGLGMGAKSKYVWPGD